MDNATMHKPKIITPAKPPLDDGNKTPLTLAEEFAVAFKDEAAKS